QHLTTMHINQSSAGPDLADCPETVETMYWSSSYFSPRDGFEMTPIALYDYNNEAGMITFQHEQGTVFLSSPHPEYEEGSDRDDAAFGDPLNDPDSEWDIMLQVSKWLVEASVVETTTATTTTNTTTNSTTSTDTFTPDLTLVGFASIGVVVVVLTVTIISKRKGV
ncbi:MAG: hypothetical protein ACTSU3_09475, partial [Candidatus Thorarchaeota archaeon]